jgi:hypothetical protein
VRLDDLTERPQADPLPIGQAPTLPPRDEIRLAVDESEKLVDQSAFTDAGLADNGDELRYRFVHSTSISILQECQLALTADQIDSRASIDVGAEPASRAHSTPQLDCFALALQRNGLERLVDDRVSRRPHCQLAGDETADRCNALQAGRRVDDVARHHPLALLGPGKECDECLTGVYRGSDGKLKALLAKFFDRLEYAQTRPDGALGIVLMCDRGSKDGHDSIADELLDRPSEAVDLLFQPCVVRA